MVRIREDKDNKTVYVYKCVECKCIWHSENRLTRCPVCGAENYLKAKALPGITRG